MDIQDNLKDLLTIECDIQTKLQQLSSLRSHSSLDSKSSEIKLLLKDYKLKLNEMKDLCGLIKSTNSSKTDVYLNELKIQSEHFSRIEIKFRNEYYAAQKRLESIERDSLLGEAGAGDAAHEGESPRQRKNVDKDMFYNQSKALNENLSDLNRTIKSSLEQSNFALNKLQTSSNNLKGTHDEFNQMSLNINDSKRLLTKFDRREFTNKLLFVCALCLFFSVVFYIIWKRLF